MVSPGPLAERVTVTMPAELVAEIDRIESNRSRFIAEAVRHELQRRLRLELQSPHPESLATAALGGLEQRCTRPCLVVSDPAVNASQRFPLIAVVPIMRAQKPPGPEHRSAGG